jgi:hypothetical protein
MYYRKQIIIFIMLIILTLSISPKSAICQTGETLYKQKCGRCHVTYSPSDYPAKDWPNIVRSMKSQAALTVQEFEDIVEYLLNESNKSSEKSHSQGPTIGGYLYTEYFRTPEKTKNFDIHYLAIYLSGWVKDNIYYFGEFELEHGGIGGDNTFVEQAYIDYWLRPNIALKIGAILTPFNRFDEFHDPLTNFIITRPQVSREIVVSAWKDVGIDLHGYINITEQSSLSFDVYSINGLGSGTNLRDSRQYRDNNEKLSFGSRFNLRYRDFIEIGGSVYKGPWDDDGKYNLTLMGSHLMLNTSIADVYGEYAQAVSQNPSPVDDGNMSGYFIQVSRLIKSSFRPTIRFGSLDYLDKGNMFGRDINKGDKDMNELSLAFSYYPTSKIVFKIEYSIIKEGTRFKEKNNDELGLQAAIRF